MSELRETRLDGVIGVEVAGVDLSQSISSTAFTQILDAFNRHSVLVIRDQQLDAHALASFARRFGPLQISANQRYCCPEEPEIMIIGNLWVDGELKSMFVNAAEDWHIDQIQTARPNLATCLYAIETPPEGGDTMFAGMHAAYGRARRRHQGNDRRPQCHLLRRVPGRGASSPGSEPPPSLPTNARRLPACHPSISAASSGDRSKVALHRSRHHESHRRHDSRGIPPAGKTAGRACN